MSEQKYPIVWTYRKTSNTQHHVYIEGDELVRLLRDTLQLPADASIEMVEGYSGNGDPVCGISLIWSETVETSNDEG